MSRSWGQQVNKGRYFFFNLINYWLVMVSTRTTAYHDMIKLLKKARETKKLSQREFAQISGWGQTSISKYERCEIRLDIIDYYKLAQLLEVEDDEILKVLHKHCKQAK
ncbi:helix-turn-helix domain-containing protein [Entomomonas asaccharolytica]|uniref:Helix-turn-helix transcriptional regulator n=1 Tax=Entomomonas asaccharolytica TaxID=2785331 RepID=A0A974RYM3_9GAMM|nr:helix-turn-helix transcriptional regulator [Entomomonas asaccharolytica]QQP86044.1 helix-turn-helix transcriptional regulator [Entomomonas asaccharolytica]